MIKRYCDRCEKEMDSFNKRELSYYQYKQTPLGKLNTVTINMEICNKCFDKFEKWLKEV